MIVRADYYAALGVSKNASKKEIKSAYRQQARQFHPDVNKEPGAEDKFKEISEAYVPMFTMPLCSSYWTLLRTTLLPVRGTHFPFLHALPMGKIGARDQSLLSKARPMCCTAFTLAKRFISHTLCCDVFESRRACA